MIFPDNFIQNKFKTPDNININYLMAGDGPPILLLHGHPQNSAMWHKIAPDLSKKYTVILADLRGYGDSDKPKGNDDHSNYSKRIMALDMIYLIENLGFKKFNLIGHDRGGRVSYRMALDHKDKIENLITLDILPTYIMYQNTNLDFATSYWHWFFLIRPFPFPENAINNDPEIYLDQVSKGRNNGKSPFSKEAKDEYIRSLQNPDTAHGICEDYRASKLIDFYHDLEDLEKGNKIECPMLALWGKNGAIEKYFDAIKEWQKFATNIQGKALNSGHYIAEEIPNILLAEINYFLK